MQISTYYPWLIVLHTTWLEDMWFSLNIYVFSTNKTDGLNKAEKFYTNNP